MNVCVRFRVVFVLLALPYHVSADNRIFVQVVWRHGDRSPYETFPNDVNQIDKWPQGWKQLTAIGMQQQYALGALLRKMYNGFISSTYNSSEIYVRSTDVDRTLMSALSNMAGFYPSGNAGVHYPRKADEPRWPSQWTPVPVHTVEHKNDLIGDPFAYCPRADQLYEQILQSDLYKDISRDNQLFDFLSIKAGYNVTLDTLWIVKEALFIEKIHNMVMPSWLNDTLYKQIVKVNNIAEDYLFGIGPNKSQVLQTEEMIKLRGGSILKAINENMQLKLFCIENPSNATCRSFRTLKYYAYSAHDVTVGALLATFGSYQELVGGGLPQFAAAVAIELWNTTAGPQVKVLYNRGANQSFSVITSKIEGCATSEYCPYSTFFNRSQPFFPKDIAKECQVQAVASSIATPTLSPPATIHLGFTALTVIMVTLNAV